MNVAGYFHHPSLILDHNGLESALEDRPALVVRPVEPAAVTDIEPTDGMTEVGLGGAHHQVIMVVHDHEGMDLHPESLRHFRQQPQKPPPVRLMEEQRRAPVASAGDVIPASRHQHS